MRPYTLKIPTGETVKPFVGNGADYVRIESASVQITVEDPQGKQKVFLEAGEDATLRQFKELHLSHGDAATQTVTIYIGRNTRKSSSKVNGDVTIVQGSAITNKAVAVGAVEVEIVAANSNRKQLIIQNNHATQYLYLGGAGVTTADGLKVAPQDTLTIDNASPAQWKGIASGAATDVRVIEVS